MFSYFLRLRFHLKGKKKIFLDAIYSANRERSVTPTDDEEEKDKLVEKKISPSLHPSTPPSSQSDRNQHCQFFFKKTTFWKKPVKFSFISFFGIMSKNDFSAIFLVLLFVNLIHMGPKFGTVVKATIIWFARFFASSFFLT